MQPVWREQYDRMRRWHYRLWLGVEFIVGGGDQAIIDVFYAFAQACDHLVDWLENDHSQHVRRVHAEAYVQSHPVLAFCGDICNGSKHAQLQARKVQTKMRKTTSSYSIEDEAGQIREQVVEQPELFVLWGGEFIEAEAFARWCIEEWDRFLRGEGLLPHLE